MVANGMLTNPTLFSNTNCTTKDCVQKWVDICYNSTLDSTTFEILSHKKHLNVTIPDRPPNLTFQCFHHHLVFMLEKFLPRRKRQVFNNLQTFDDVLQFLKLELEIIPRLFDVTEYLNNRPISLSYEGREEVYFDLKQRWHSEQDKDVGFYDYGASEGKFFKDKLRHSESDYDLSDMFIKAGWSTGVLFAGHKGFFEKFDSFCSKSSQKLLQNVTRYITLFFFETRILAR